MAITTSARRRVYWVREQTQDARLQGIRSAVYSLRSFVEVEPDPAGKKALLQAADALELIHEMTPRQ
jgi:hypothetical protein